MNAFMQRPNGKSNQNLEAASTSCRTLQACVPPCYACLCDLSVLRPVHVYVRVPSLVALVRSLPDGRSCHFLCLPAALESATQCCALEQVWQDWQASQLPPKLACLMSSLPYICLLKGNHFHIKSQGTCKTRMASSYFF